MIDWSEPVTWNIRESMKWHMTGGLIPIQCASSFSKCSQLSIFSAQLADRLLVMGGLSKCPHYLPPICITSKWPNQFNKWFKRCFFEKKNFCFGNTHSFVHLIHSARLAKMSDLLFHWLNIPSFKPVKSIVSIPYYFCAEIGVLLSTLCR